MCIRDSFTTDASGAVTDLDITPAELGAGTIGRCVAAIGRRIHFGPVVGARTFRIPITIRTE